MTTDVHPVTIDPHVDGQASLPDVPSAGLVLVSVDADASEACGRHLLDFARRWRDDGRRVFLCDACFESPFLHEAAGMPNGEGVSDTLLYGTTFGRISHRIERDLAVAPAGTVVGDPTGVRDHARWTTIIAGFEEAGALFVVAVPAGAEAPALAGAAAAHLAFAGDPGDAEGTAAEMTYLVPPSVETAAPMEPEPAREEEHALVAEAGHPFTLDDSAADAAPAATIDAGAEAEAPDDAIIYPNRPDPRRPAIGSSPGETVREVKRRRGSPVLLVLLLVVAVLLALGFFGIVEIPGVTPADVDVPSTLLPTR